MKCVNCGSKEGLVRVSGLNFTRKAKNAGDCFVCAGECALDSGRTPEHGHPLKLYPALRDVNLYIVAPCRGDVDRAYAALSLMFADGIVSRSERYDVARRGFVAHIHWDVMWNLSALGNAGVNKIPGCKFGQFRFEVGGTKFHFNEWDKDAIWAAAGRAGVQ